MAFLHLQVTKFADALSLADMCDAQRAPLRAAILQEPGPNSNLQISANSQYIRWKQLAADAGAIAIYNFAELIHTIDGLIGMVPTAKERLDKDAMKAGRSVFRAAFPDYADVRFAVTHAGKPFASPDANKNQRLPDTNVMIINMLRDRTLYSTVNGKEVSYTLELGALEALQNSLEHINRSFAAVGAILDQDNSAQQREM